MVSPAYPSASAETPIDADQQTTMELPRRPKPSNEDDTDFAIASAPADDKDGGDDVTEPAAERGVPDQQEFEIKKKKKKSKGKRSGKGKKKITGFEENYVDAPITPAEHEEEKGLYDKTLPAVRRLETAIQRFQAKRRMDSNRKTVFTKYLLYGGVDVGPKMFEGDDYRNFENMDADDIITATAEASIPEDREEWDVDFELVAKGFFSSVVPAFFALDAQEEVDMATSTIKNFLNYILYHRVCPEYESSILAARGVCLIANKELYKAHQAGVWAPGDFNMACSTLFGGAHFDGYTGDQKWLKDGDGVAGMPSVAARKVVKFAIASAGSIQHAFRFRDLANANRLDAECINENGFEVLAIEPPVYDVKHFYHENAPELKPVGVIRARPWRDPGLPDEDAAPGEGLSDVNGNGYGQAEEYEFFMEEALLGMYFIGMKVSASVWRMNCGVHYFDKVVGVYCSFYTVLPNGDMIGWKKPRDLRPDEYVMGDGGPEKSCGDAADPDPEPFDTVDVEDAENDAAAPPDTEAVPE